MSYASVTCQLKPCGRLNDANPAASRGARRAQTVVLGNTCEGEGVAALSRAWCAGMVAHVGLEGVKGAARAAAGLERVARLVCDK